jgi:transposase
MQKSTGFCPGLPSIVTTVIVNTIDEHFPPKKCGSPRKLKTIEALHYCFLVLRSGMPWRTLEYCIRGNYTWHTIFYRFKQWNRKNIFEKAYNKLLVLYNKRRELRHPISFVFSDTSFIKNIFGVNCVGPSPVDRGRSATKISVICDDVGVVHSLTFHPSNKSDCCILRHTLNKQKRSYWQGKTMCADKGYDTQNCRLWLRENGLQDCIIRKKSPKHIETSLSSKRTIVENVFAWLDTSRRLIMRYEKSISTYRSFTYLALCPIVGRRFDSNLCV